MEKSIKQSNLESCNSIRDKFDNNSDVDLSIRRINPVNTSYSEAHETEGTNRVKNKHLYLASANEIDEKKLELPSHLEYAYLHDHLSRLENPHMEVLTEREIADEFPDNHLMLLKSKFNDDEPWAIMCILERSVGYNPKDWPEKLNDALWAFRMAYKTPTGCTPFILIYRKTCHLPVEIEHKAHWALKQCKMDLVLASKSYLIQLNELAGLSDDAYENTRIYKERTKKWHDFRLRVDKYLRHATKVYPYAAVEIINRNGFCFKVNGQRLKKYYEGNIDKEDDEVIDFENGVT
ncbi:reverse transcriptase domain-containing protein [Tanacetum coccineum]|uniref:Reverse transcriptase domain-containing protein n=1 Tax=Tanacetum coccineum TaxID=301880 RepID=A0ABQ4WHL7_9ASTR